MKGAVIGTIMPWTGGLSAVPAGWIICDGSEVEADEYPLLTQAIGDTYNEGTSNLSGSFPTYNGNSTIVLPDLLSSRMLMDIEPEYFGNGGRSVNITTEINGQTVGIDADPDAVLLIEPLCTGLNRENAAPTVFAGANSLKTDVEFTLNVNSGYGGNISGNTIIDGVGEREVYIGGRKLGHHHIRSHAHSGGHATVSWGDDSRPGGGVVPWDYITMRWSYKMWDNINNVSDGVDVDERSAGSQIDNLLAIFRWYYGDPEDVITLIDSDSKNSFGNIEGWGNGLPGRSLGSGNSENPPINLGIPNLNLHPVVNAQTDWYASGVGNNSNAGRLDSEDVIPYGLGGQNLQVPLGYYNYYLEDGGNANYGTLMSNDSFAWSEDSLVAHGHDPFLVEYDQGTLKPNSRITANATVPATTTLDNEINKGALEIIMDSSQPSLTCVYIIRAY